MKNRANIILTHKCNLKCLHCYMCAGKSKESEKTIFKETKVLIDKLCDDKIYSVMFTGGECMLFPYLEELIDYAHSKDMNVSIFTNGMIYNEAVFDKVDSIYMSLDGPEETHNYIRQNKNSFQNVIKVLGYLKKIDAHTTLQITISKLNENKLDFLKKILKEHLNVRTVKLVLVSNEGRALANKIAHNKKTIDIILDKMIDLYQSTLFHIQYTFNYINYFDYKNYYMTGNITFPIWFDMVDMNFYMFKNKKKYSKQIAEYKIESIQKFNKNVLKELKEIEQLYNNNKYVNIEEKLNKGDEDVR